MGRQLKGILKLDADRGNSHAVRPFTRDGGQDAGRVSLALRASKQPVSSRVLVMDWGRHAFRGAGIWDPALRLSVCWASHPVNSASVVHVRAGKPGVLPRRRDEISF
jgi:hypothetical protein